MCCFFSALIFFGPRLGFLVYWLINPVRVNLVFNTFIWPLLGLIFFPWTTLMYLLVFPITTFDWIWLAIALLIDLASYGGGAYNRRRIPGYSGR